jgi:hypothetical protein
LHALAFADNLHRTVWPNGIAAAQAVSDGSAAAAAAAAETAEVLLAVWTAPVQEELEEVSQFAGPLLAE